MRRQPPRPATDAVAKILALLVPAAASWAAETLETVLGEMAKEQTAKVEMDKAASAAKVAPGDAGVLWVAVNCLQASRTPSTRAWRAADSHRPI